MLFSFQSEGFEATLAQRHRRQSHPPRLVRVCAEFRLEKRTAPHRQRVSQPHPLESHVILLASFLFVSFSKSHHHLIQLIVYLFGLVIVVQQNEYFEHVHQPTGAPLSTSQRGRVGQLHADHRLGPRATHRPMQTTRLARHHQLSTSDRQMLPTLL